MLIARIFVNHDQIDEVWIQNTGEVRRGIYTYQIRKPEGIDAVITHERAKGWESLLMRALSEITFRRKNGGALGRRRKSQRGSNCLCREKEVMPT